jgi:hypothetical protein
MKQPGPKLEVLLRRLAETPSEFLLDPKIGKRGAIAVAPLVNDLLAVIGDRATRKELSKFESDISSDRNRLGLVLIVVWLLSGEWRSAISVKRENVFRCLSEVVSGLSEGTPAHQFIRDPDRREELARTMLCHLDLLPEGETEIYAIDRLSSVSGLERKRLLQASRIAEQRAREIRAALVKKAADESADKWTRE